MTQHTPIQTDEEIALSPCPFCGSAARFVYHQGGWPNSHNSVDCTNYRCNGRAFRASKHEAAEAWNTRPAPTVGLSADLRQAAVDVLSNVHENYKAGNGRMVGIQGDDGEKCWIIHSDFIDALERAVRATPMSRPASLQGEAVAWRVTEPGVPCAYFDTKAMAERYLFNDRGVIEPLYSLPVAEGGEAELQKLRDQIEELQAEAKLFDESHADQNRMVDRIADLIGLPQDQELDTTAFEMWFSDNAHPAPSEAKPVAWRYPDDGGLKEPVRELGDVPSVMACTLSDFMRRADASPPASVMQSEGWQDIATAPKDGRPILVRYQWQGKNRFRVIRRSKTHNWWISDTGQQVVHNDDAKPGSMEETTNLKPTLWAELPDPEADLSPVPAAAARQHAQDGEAAWPPKPWHCAHKNSCMRHKQCMYVGCFHDPRSHGVAGSDLHSSGQAAQTTGDT